MEDPLRQAILAEHPDVFCSQWLFESVPHLFQGDARAYLDWRMKLASALEIDPRDMLIIGSAAVGVSLSPQKRFKSFGASSDIDVAVISIHHFDVSWRYLRNLGAAYHALPKKTKIAVNSHRANYVFSGTIATDRILPYLPFGRVWMEALSKASRESPAEGRSVNIRLYRDSDSLRSYHSAGIRDLQQQLLSEGV